MTYRELLRLYKEGKLSEPDRREVASAIERQDAISEYLYEEDDLSNMSTGDEAEINVPDSEPVIRLIRKNIRTAFVKMGVAVAVILLILGLFAAFGLPRIVDHLYYDPTISAYDGDRGDGVDMNQLELDMRVYSELFLPLRYMDAAYAEAEGYGNYNFYLTQTAYPIYSKPAAAGGKISRNRITFYDPSVLDPPVDNVFEWTSQTLDTGKALSEQMGKTREVNVIDDKTGKDTVKKERISPNSTVGGPEEARAYIKNMPAGEYTAYLSLDRIISYEDACRLADNWNLGPWWCGIWLGSHGEQIMGMRGSLLSYDDQSSVDGYSYLLGYEDSKKEDGSSASSAGENYSAEYPRHAREHFLSLLQYMKDQKNFDRMMNIEEVLLSDDGEDGPADYVKKHGLKVYGIAIRADKAKLLKLLNDDAVYTISVE